jgi:phosphohistidine phosphatase
MAHSGPRLLLVRHGIAEDRSEVRPDGLRALTPAGRRRTTAVLERAVALGLTADRLVSSPLVRARQTAEIALSAGLAPCLELATALEPGADPLPLLARWLASTPIAVAPQSPGSHPLGAASAPRADPSTPAADRPMGLALVGHEPDLGDLAARLLGAPLGSIALRKAGLALLVLPRSAQGRLEDQAAAGAWRLQLLLTPRTLLA